MKINTVHLINFFMDIILPNGEIASHKEEIDKYIAELVIANKELLFQNEEKGNRAKELAITVEQLKQSEEKLRVANEELEAFSYSVSHDLRAPLRAVGSYAQMLEEDYTDVLDANGKRLLGIVKQSAVKMGVLIDDLLTLSRIGKKEMRLSKVNMTNLTHRIIEELTQLNNHKAKILVNPLPLVMADAALIGHALTNLLSNAIKYSAKTKDPHIEVTAHLENEEAVFSITDNGAGFDMRYQKKLFHVFQRLHKDKEFEGTGIGLAITKRIIDKHNGKIWAVSELGKGATFYFTLQHINN
jgi:light-regulated signal transduction histidine kinase (bacteriophytochrome)